MIIRGLIDVLLRYEGVAKIIQVSKVDGLNIA